MWIAPKFISLIAASLLNGRLWLPISHWHLCLNNTVSACLIFFWGTAPFQHFAGKSIKGSQGGWKFEFNELVLHAEGSRKEETIVKKRFSRILKVEQLQVMTRSGVLLLKG